MQINTGRQPQRDNPREREERRRHAVVFKVYERFVSSACRKTSRSPE